MNESHQRFQDWLIAGAEGEPHRGLAVHAWVCPACRQSILALDLLAMADPGRARQPALQPVVERGALGRGARLAGLATAGLFAAVVVGVGASQLINLSRGGLLALASPTPNQQVFGGMATAHPTAGVGSASPGETLTLPDISSEPGGATPAPGSTARPIIRPGATPHPTGVPIAAPTSGASGTTAPTPTEVPTAAPTPGASGATAPTPTEVPTVPPTPVATPVPTIEPTPVPTPTPIPTEPGAPSLEVAMASSSTAVDLDWTAPDDGGSPISNYRIYRNGVPIIDVGNVTFFTDSTASASTAYSYQVAAINGVGEGALSNALEVTTPDP